jgi:hypothetical protein
MIEIKEEIRKFKAKILTLRSSDGGGNHERKISLCNAHLVVVDVHGAE